jgi:hypothetical protein
MFAVHECGQAVDTRLGDDDHAAAVTPIAAIRSSARHELFAPKADTPVAPTAGFHFDRDTVDEHGV